MHEKEKQKRRRYETSAPSCGIWHFPGFQITEFDYMRCGLQEFASKFFSEVILITGPVLFRNLTDHHFTVLHLAKTAIFSDTEFVLEFGLQVDCAVRC